MAFNVDELRRVLHATPIENRKAVIGLSRECIAELLALIDEKAAMEAALRKEKTVARICSRLLTSADARTAL